MSTPFSENSSSTSNAYSDLIQDYIKELFNNISRFHISNDTSDNRARIVAYIDQLLAFLKSEKISVNQLFVDHPEMVQLIFTTTGPSHAVRDIILKHGFDINSKVATGEYPLFYACRDGNAEIAKYLIQRGARFDIAHQEHTAVGVATINHEFDVSLLANDIACKDFVAQYNLIQNSMFLAHRWSLNGSGHLGNDQFDDLTYASQILLRNSLIQSFAQFSNINKENLFKLCNQICPNVTSEDIQKLIDGVAARLRSANDPDRKGISEAIENGQTCPVPLETFFPDGGTHHESLIFYGKNKLMRINRGIGSDGRTGIEMNTIANPDKIGMIVEAISNAEMDAESIHHILEEYLGLKKIRLINMKEQTAPTCKWITEKSAFYGVLYAELLELFQLKGLAEGAADEAARLVARDWYKKTTINDRLQFTKNVLELFPEKSIEQMPLLVKELLFKIYRGANFNVQELNKEKYVPIIQLLDERGMKAYLDLNQKFVAAVEHENEEVLLNYIEKGVIGNRTIGGVDSLLNVLVKRGFYKAVEALLENGTSANPVPPAIVSILNTAIKMNDLKMIDLLMKYHAHASPQHIKDIEELRKKARESKKEPIPSADLLNNSVTLVQFQMTSNPSKNADQPKTVESSHLPQAEKSPLSEQGTQPDKGDSKSGVDKPSNQGPSGL